MSGDTIKPEDRPGWRPRKNCHTCARNWQAPASGYNYCLMLQGDDVYEGTMEWMEDTVVGTGSDMPPPSADGCPGWVARGFLAPEYTDRAQLAALGDESIVDGLMRRAGVGGVPESADEIPKRPDTGGWRGNLPLRRGPGSTTAARLRRAGLPVRGGR